MSLDPDSVPVPSDPGADDAAPPPLLAAAILVGVEAILLLVQGVAELFTLTGSRALMGVTTALFFFVYGGGLGICGWLLARLRSWARAPVVVAQVIQILVAWSFRGGDTTLVSVGLGVLAVAVLVGIFAPASLTALERAR